MPQSSAPRVRTVLVLALATVIPAAACSGAGGSDATGGATDDRPAAGWSFPDGRGGTVELDRTPVVVVAQSVVAGALWELGVVADGVFGPLRRADGSTDPSLGIADPDDFTSLGEVHGHIGVEKLAALHPDVIVTAMWDDDRYWGVEDATLDELEAIAPIVGIRLDDRPVTEPLARIAELAASLGADADRIATARAEFEAASARLGSTLAAKPGLQAVAASRSPNELYVAWPPGWPDLSYYRSLGLDLAIPEDHPTSGGFWETLSWEAAGKYPADLILADSRGGTIDDILAFLPPSARRLPAVEAGQLAPWDAAPAYGYRNFARLLDRLAADVARARTDVAP